MYIGSTLNYDYPVFSSEWYLFLHLATDWFQSRQLATHSIGYVANQLVYLCLVISFFDWRERGGAEGGIQ